MNRNSNFQSSRTFNYPISQEPIVINRGGVISSVQASIESNTDNKNMYCLLGNDECSPLCSGYTKNSCNIVAPIPGGPWQVQNAETVQNNLTKQNYTPSKCPMN
jgi:hypothetical protein